MHNKKQKINTHIIYVSFHCSEHLFEHLFKDKQNKPGQAVQKYNRLLAEGLAQLDGVQVTAITECPINSDNYSRKYLYPHKEYIHDIDYRYLPLINIHRVKDIFSVITSFFCCIQQSLKYSRRKVKTIVLSDVLNAPVAIGGMFAAKLCRVEYYTIITDIPELVFKNKDKIYKQTSNYIIDRADGYILLTKQMNEYIRNFDKKYVIIEGLVDILEKDKNDSEKDKRKICMYTGLIDKKYGIAKLVEAFIKADFENYELHIYGDGDYAEELVKVTDQYKMVKYFGTKLSSYIVKQQKKATLLINPRPTNEEYTKYSFPSKNMEYMVSGTPVLTTDLPGMPEEYRQYIYLFEDESIDGYCNTLKDVLGKSQEALKQKGENAKKFVLEYKNNIIQAQKVMDLIKQE